MKKLNIFAVTALALMVSGCGGGSSGDVGADAPVTPIPPQYNYKPVAVIESEAHALVGANLELSGLKSHDRNNDVLTYKWVLVGKPVGSKAQILHGAKSTAIFKGDISGTYVVQLVVNDGVLDSDPVNMEIHVRTADANNPPVAKFHDWYQLDLKVGERMILQNASTDPDNDPVTPSWDFEKKPVGSKTVIDTQTYGSGTIIFTPDLPGEYVVRLTATDIFGASSSARLKFDVVDGNSKPRAAISSEVDTAEINQDITFSALGTTDVDRDKLKYKFTIVGQPAGSTPRMFNNGEFTDSMVAFLRGDVAGEYVVQLEVSDGKSVSDAVRKSVEFYNPGLKLRKISTGEYLSWPHTGSESLSVDYSCGSPEGCDIWTHDIGGYTLQASDRDYTLIDFRCTADYDVQQVNLSQPKKCNHSLHNPLMPHMTQFYIPKSKSEPTPIWFYALVDSVRPVTYTFSYTVKETGQKITHQAVVQPTRNYLP